VDCTLNRNLLEGYLDGELGFESALEVEAHIASCPGCAADVESWKGIRGAIERADLYHRAPSALEAKVREMAPAADARTGAPHVGSVGWLQRWLWAGGGAAFATAALLLAFVASRPAAPSVAQEVATSHIRSMMADHLMDVVSTDQHTVKPWFDGKIDFAPPVKDFAAEGYPLAGGRLDYLENRKVAVLVYHRALHVINVYVWPAVDNGSTEIKTETVRGYNVLAWKKDGFEFRAASDLNAAEMRDLAHLITP
jgi:anti-sigma factor RsiW